MQVVSLHAEDAAGVIVARSARWQTTCTVLHGGENSDPAAGETFVVDSPLYQDELDALPAILAQTGWSVSGLLATHADWDHLLARLAFPNASLGVAETTAARLKAHPGEAQRELRAFDAEDYVARPRPLSLGQVQALPVPGTLDLGGHELELLPADGHTEDGMAVWAAFAAVLVPGDYLSPVEIPWLSPGGSRDAYLATLERLRPYVERAEWVVSGHGGPIDGERAGTLLDEDVAYLAALPDASLPPGRDGTRQREIHAENVERAG